MTQRQSDGTDERQKSLGLLALCANDALVIWHNSGVLVKSDFGHLSFWSYDIQLVRRWAE